LVVVKKLFFVTYAVKNILMMLLQINCERIGIVGEQFERDQLTQRNIEQVARGISELALQSAEVLAHVLVEYSRHHSFDHVIVVLVVDSLRNVRIFAVVHVYLRQVLVDHDKDMANLILINKNQ
jgi:hypothetical protein